MMLSVRFCVRLSTRPDLTKTVAKRFSYAARSEKLFRTAEKSAKSFMPKTFQTSERLGKALLAGAGSAGLLALCYYGLGSSVDSAADKAIFWPPHIRERISSTYSYFAGSIAVTAAAGYAFSRSKRAMNFMMKRPYLNLGMFLVGTIGSMTVCMSTPYSPGSNFLKLSSFGTMCAVAGASLAPLAAIGGPLIARAIMYTGGVVGALSLTAACAPSDKFLSWSGPLSIGLGVVVVSSLGGLFLPITSAVGGLMYNVSLYGGLVLFSGFLLYDTQKVIKIAETSPTFDPVNACLSIYWDTINIFIRIVTILSSSKKK